MPLVFSLGIFSSSLATPLNKIFDHIDTQPIPKCDFVTDIICKTRYGLSHKSKVHKNIDGKLF